MEFFCCHWGKIQSHVTGYGYIYAVSNGADLRSYRISGGLVKDSTQKVDGYYWRINVVIVYSLRGPLGVYVYVGYVLLGFIIRGCGRAYKKTAHEGRQ